MIARVSSLAACVAWTMIVLKATQIAPQTVFWGAIFVWLVCLICGGVIAVQAAISVANAKIRATKRAIERTIR